PAWEGFGGQFAQAAPAKQLRELGRCSWDIRNVKVRTHPGSQASSAARKFGEYFDRIAGWINNGAYLNHLRLIAARSRVLRRSNADHDTWMDLSQKFLRQGHANSQGRNGSDPEEPIISYNALSDPDIAARYDAIERSSDPSLLQLQLQ